MRALSIWSRMKQIGFVLMACPSASKVCSTCAKAAPRGMEIEIYSCKLGCGQAFLSISPMVWSPQDWSLHWAVQDYFQSHVSLHFLTYLNESQLQMPLDSTLAKTIIKDTQPQPTMPWGRVVNDDAGICIYSNSIKYSQFKI